MSNGRLTPWPVNEKIGAINRDGLKPSRYIAAAERGSQSLGRGRSIVVPLGRAGAESDVIDTELPDLRRRLAGAAQQHSKHRSISLEVAMIGRSENGVWRFHQH